MSTLKLVSKYDHLGTTETFVTPHQSQSFSIVAGRDVPYYLPIVNQHIEASRQLATYLSAVKQYNIVQFFEQASEESGNFVKMSREYSCLPVLLDSANEPIPLFRLVEEIEELIDPSDLRETFPTLSYSQIVGALTFLRKLSQFNSQDIDVETIGDVFSEESEEFKAIIRQSQQDLENSRVLDISE